MFGVVEVRAQCDSLNNKKHGYKHYPNNNLNLKDIINSTKSGPAKYFPGVDIPSIEATALKVGIRDGDYVWYKSNLKIGASKGTETEYIRIDISANTYHGHPVTKQEVINIAGNKILKELDK